MLPNIDRPDDASPPPAVADGAPRPTLEEVYDRHAAMVWRALRGLGVPADRVDDAVQDVFLVVHRRLGDFEGRASIATWLHAIARRVAGKHRRRDAGAPLDRDHASAEDSPLETAQRHQAARLVLAILDELDDDKREVFALMELEQLTAPAVATLLGIPLNTVYSRLRLARQRFDAALARRMPPEETP